MCAQKDPEKDLDKLYEDSKCKIGPKLNYLKSVDYYATDAVYETISLIIQDLTWLFTTGKSTEKICNRVVNFMVVEGFPPLVVKILKSLTDIAGNAAFKSLYVTHSVLWKLLYNLNYVSPEARKLVRRELVKNGITKTLFEDLRSCDPSTDDPRQRTRILCDIYTLRTLTMFGDTPSVIPIYRAGKAVDTLMNFAQSDFTMIKARSLTLLSNIVNEEESKQLVTTDGCVIIVDLIRKALESDRPRYSFTVNIDDDEKKTFHMSVWGLVEGLNNLASNDSNKAAIMDHEGVQVLTSVLRVKVKQDVEAKQAAVEALWKLAFVDGNVEAILTHLTFADPEALEELKKMRSSSTPRLRDASTGLLHQLGLIDIHDERPDEKEVSSDNNQDPPPSYEEATGGLRVLISYNWDNQERAIEIRDRLRKNGCSIWMDIDKMRGNILMAMAEGVEKADVMLMCYSRKYKSSACCQAEANYAFKLQKPIIPVKMEEDYEADGWLGLLAGMNMCIMAYSDEVMETNWSRLFVEIESIARK